MASCYYKSLNFKKKNEGDMTKNGVLVVSHRVQETTAIIRSNKFIGLILQALTILQKH